MVVELECERDQTSEELMPGIGESEIERGKGRLGGEMIASFFLKEWIFCFEIIFRLFSLFLREELSSSLVRAGSLSEHQTLASLALCLSLSLRRPQNTTKTEPATIAAAANPQAALASLAKASTVVANAAAAAGLESVAMAAPAKVDAPAVLADLKMLVVEELRVRMRAERTQRDVRLFVCFFLSPSCAMVFSHPRLALSQPPSPLPLPPPSPLPPHSTHSKQTTLA